MLQRKESIKLLNSNYIILSIVLGSGTLPIEPFFYNNRVVQKLIFHPFLLHENDRLKQFY
ncbi:hypothetical protein D1609_00255 [Leptospira borgpetersenii serovar Hardjo-bovis]|nr:hypothetical protein D1609_00255 [Leptospira borgpetersenii serovar Hardjo-bovis]TQE52465.1 hypothetical protein FFZ95_10470 [Leptospira borgpetersenii]TQE53027.1 hypothetical protein FFZ96_15630 [Leptospira borgpetersenii]